MERYILWLDEGLPVLRRGADGRGAVVARGSSLYSGDPGKDADSIRSLLGLRAPIEIRGSEY